MADPRAHQRRSIRLKGYDYAQPGAYFVTICTANRQPILGEIVNGAMRLSAAGRIVEQEWRRLVRHFPNIRLDAYVIMPNHLHGIIVINESVGATRIMQDVTPEPDAPGQINDLSDGDGSPVREASMVGATRHMLIKAMDGNAPVEINHLPDTIGSPGQDGATRTMQDMTPEPDTPGQINDLSDRDGSPVQEESMVGATRPMPIKAMDGNAPLEINHLPDTIGSPKQGGATLADQHEATFDRDGSPVREGRPKGPGAGSLGAMIGQFKSRVTRRIWSLAAYDHIPIWHRNYYEHIIRNEIEWGRICEYIHNNPACWAEDLYHPNRPELP
jgi:putative transposase